MKSRISIIVALATIASTQSYAQEKEKVIKLNSIVYYKGLFNFYPQLEFDTHNDFLNITTSKEHFTNLDKDFNWNDSYSFGAGNGLYGSGTRIQLGFNTKNFKTGIVKSNRSINVGVFTNRISFYERGIKTEVYGDTTITTRAQYNLSYNYLGVDINHLFSTDAERLVRFHTGYGFEAGLSFYQKGKRTEWENRSLRIVQGNNIYQISLDQNSYPHANEGDQVNTKFTSFYQGIYVPLGIDVRLSKKRALLKDLSIGLDTRVGFNFYSLGGKAPVVTQNLSMNTVIRYRFSNS